MKLLFPITLLTLAACTASTSEPPPSSNPSGGQCDASKAQHFVSQRVTDNTGAEVLTLTGARELRWGPPDSAWTMDYREDRVNIRYNRDMIIEDVTCG